MIKAKNVTVEYYRRDEDMNVSEIVEAVKHVSLEIKPGEFVFILGKNGSGKSTFAKLLNGLLMPIEGTIWVDGIDTSKEETLWDIRCKTGMVFQNPDNQIVGTIVEEDVAFGPENLGIDTPELKQRVRKALNRVSLEQHAGKTPHHLSGGQKQRVAIAGILAMEPKCIIFDESTSMLDPQGRREVLETAIQLNREKNITIIFITHDMQEAMYGDYVYVMEQGEVKLEGTPREIFAHGRSVEKYGLELPYVTQIAVGLRERGIDISQNILTQEELFSELQRIKAIGYLENIKNEKKIDYVEYEAQEDNNSNEASHAQQDRFTKGLVLNHVDYTYQPGTIYEKKALDQISLTIGQGEFVAVIGHTGSGKSTLMQLLNGLYKPTQGEIYFDGENIHSKGYNRKHLREKVGLVFQYPEHQLFAQTVLEDVSFGPTNMEWPKLQIQLSAFEAIKQVGLSEDVYDVSPFELSGGQKRRVALAGVLAMKPEYLILDEPVAGLDPAGRNELLELLKELNRHGMTIILVSHSMEDVAKYAKRILVFHQGHLVQDGTREEIFEKEDMLKDLGLNMPWIGKFMNEYRQRGYEGYEKAYTLEKAIDILYRELVR